MANPTLRSLLALPTEPAPLSKSVLIMIDCQNTYRRGVMALEGVEPALIECATMLDRARSAGATVIHIQHDAGAGSPYDVRGESGAIIDLVAPRTGEAVIVKAYPSSFEQTDLHARLQTLGATDLVLAGFMTHMCVNSTARAAFNHGYRPTVVANATATRVLANPVGREPSAQLLHEMTLTGLADLFAIVVRDGRGVPN
jgi:nicotinamidase-related amidase